MKKLFTYLIFTLIVKIGFSQIVIFDTINKTPIPNVSVILGSNNFTTISDLDGTIQIKKGLIE